MLRHWRSCHRLNPFLRWPRAVRDLSRSIVAAPGEPGPSRWYSHSHRNPAAHSHSHWNPAAHSHRNPAPHSHSHWNPAAHSHRNPAPHSHSHWNPAAHSHRNPAPHSHSHWNPAPHSHRNPAPHSHSHWNPAPHSHSQWNPVLHSHCPKSRPLTTERRPVRIGCASGFWGDTATSVPQLVFGGNLDFLVFDYLSEITMSLLAAAKAKSPNHGYVPDFVEVAMAPFIKDIQKRGIRVVCNAGGVNPHACAAALQEVVKKADLELKIGVVTGDDLMLMKDLLKEAGITDMDSGSPFPATVQSMNAYLGARPISRALDLGADIVVTGRCIDSGIALGPLIHSFGWKQNDFDLLAAGSLAGHLIECGAQCTGGIFTDWHRVPDWDNIGFPVVECSSDGSFVLSKPPKTGGLVSFGTVAEQLAYEIGNPRRYQLPDVICDFSQVTLLEIPDIEGGAVRVQGARGLPPSDTYKVCATYLDGYRATAVCPVGGSRSVEKGRRTAESILKRMRRMFKQIGLDDFKSVNVQILGSEETYGEQAVKRTDCCGLVVQSPREVVIWLAVHHMQKKALELFSREIAPAGTGMAPGLTGIVGGRPKVSPVLKPFFFLHPKQNVTIDIFLNGKHVEMFKEDFNYPPSPALEENIEEEDDLKDLPIGPCSYRLEELAYTRSGDKGNSANIGVVARHPLYYPYLRKAVTAKAVEEYFQHLIQNEDSDRRMVTRFDLPGIQGLNFVLRNSLGGGGIASLRSDPQGKAYGQMLLDFRLRHLPDLKTLIEE
ncbi:uncharacterized protein LOC121283940 [Carcharodon carcharias]|uniref:uncharacterized protein LOC121283940 n=1 Tax=Carcharodon carcharias TaxID=13397 RepID=UPI001B7D9A5B|nr:uncharacterized protein LOC121283940 [Carcharodon carcharias]